MATVLRYDDYRRVNARRVKVRGMRRRAGVRCSIHAESGSLHNPFALSFELIDRDGNGEYTQLPTRVSYVEVMRGRLVDVASFCDADIFNDDIEVNMAMLEQVLAEEAAIVIVYREGVATVSVRHPAYTTQAVIPPEYVAMYFIV